MDKRTKLLLRQGILDAINNYEYQMKQKNYTDEFYHGIRFACKNIIKLLEDMFFVFGMKE